MLSATYKGSRSDVHPTLRPSSNESDPATVEQETVVDDEEEIEVGGDCSMDQCISNTDHVQEQPEDLSVKKEKNDGDSVSSMSPRPTSTSPALASSSPESQKGVDTGRSVKRIKPIPPPLDLNARTLTPTDTLPTNIFSPASQVDIPQDTLPIRKR